MSSVYVLCVLVPGASVLCAVCCVLRERSAGAMGATAYHQLLEQRQSASARAHGSWQLGAGYWH